MFYIVGLGNPGKEYEGTRHNTGRSFLDYVQKKGEFSDWKFDKKLNANSSTGTIGKKKVTLLQPDTFMNNSGNSVKPLALSKKALEGLCVVYDDMDIPLGSMKIVFNRGDGGHNGLASIIKAVKSREFPRIRLGVSPATAKGMAKKPSGEEKVIKFLMTKFREPEMVDLKKVWKKANESLEVMFNESREKAMTLFN